VAKPTPGQQNQSRDKGGRVPGELEKWLRKRLIGYHDDVLTVLAAACLAERSVLFLGRHGLGKTTLAKCMAELLGSRWVHYDAAKDDLISIAGLPSASALGEGRLEFAAHDRTIWDKEVVLLDEITRANKENQNLWLEILEERRLLGKPVPCRLFLATCNPDTYAATYSLDEALLDRFAVVVDLPDFQDARAPAITQIMDINLRVRPGQAHVEPPPIDGAKLRESLRLVRRTLLKNEDLVAAVTRWGGQLVQRLFDPETRFMSPRTFGHHLPNVLFDLLAYDGLGEELTNRRLEKLARVAVRFVLASKYKIPQGAVDEALNVASPALREWVPSKGSDPLCGLEGGPLSFRIKHLGFLAQTPLLPTQEARLEGLALALAREALEAPGDEDYVADFWDACSRFPEARKLLEIQLFQERVDDLLGLQSGHTDAAELVRQGLPLAPNYRVAL
jgi:MoxR-like ATPase